MAQAQRSAVPVVGYLASSELVSPFVVAFRQGLTEFGFVEGSTVTIDYRSADGHFDRLPVLAEDFVRRRVAAIDARHSKNRVAEISCWFESGQRPPKWPIETLITPRVKKPWSKGGTDRAIVTAQLAC